MPNTSPTPPTVKKRTRLAVEPLNLNTDAPAKTRCPECGKEWVNGTDAHREEIASTMHVAHLSESEEAWSRREEQRARIETECMDRRAALSLGTEADDRHKPLSER